MGCALNACYATTPLTYEFTQTFTTTTDGTPVTSTTTSRTITTPSVPTGPPSDQDKGTWPKFLPETVPKVSEIPSNENAGLTQTQLGGIVGGVLGLLVIVLVATFIIVRRLRKTAKLYTEASKKESSSGDRRSRPGNPRGSHYRPGPYRPAPSQVNQTDDDEMLQRMAGDRQSAQTSGYSTPFPSSNSEARNTSMDNGFFQDVPARVQNVPGRHSMSTDVRTSVDSHHTAQLPRRQHTRNMSNASELSEGSNGGGGVGSPLLPAELGVEGGFFPELPGTPLDVYGRRRSSGGPVSPLSMVASRPSVAQSRRRSDAQTRDRSSSSAAAQGGPSLDAVAESVEQMHGYFGPQHVAEGQTRAGVHLGYDLSSPVVPRLHQQPPPP